MNFVTGGTGLLGSHLLFELSEKNKPIRALYRSEDRINNVRALFKFYTPSDWEKRFARIEWVKGDILDISLLTELIDPDAIIYHCAAIVSFDPKDFHHLIKINREGTANVVNAAIEKKASCLCHVSSTAAIGGEDHELITEETKWKSTPTTSAYSQSKYGAEREVWRGIEEGLESVIVNPCVILGAGDWNDSSLTIFRTLEKGLRYYPPGANATVDARDVARIMIRLVENGIRSERFLCIGSNQSFLELMTAISEELKTKKPSRLINRNLADFVRKLLGLISVFTRRRPTMTKETVNSMFAHRAYSSKKIKDRLNYSFYSLQEQVENAVRGRIQSKNS